MIRYLLDTNTISYFVKGVSASLIQRMQVGLDAQDIAISAMTRAEVRYGVEMMEKSDKRRRRIDLLLTELPALPWSVEAADEFGRLKTYLRRSGTPVGDFDTQIAAHARAENLILVTHNTRHFQRIPGLKLEDWML
jgi:tRNA(fMet)-specific endonuclease VapC